MREWEGWSQRVEIERIMNGGSVVRGGQEVRNDEDK